MTHNPSSDKKQALSAREAEEAAIASWLSENRPKKLRKGRANAPPIVKIRRAVKNGEALVVRRSFGRDIVYRAQPPRGENVKRTEEHPVAAAPPRRRRRRRSAKKQPAKT